VGGGYPVVVQDASSTCTPTLQPLCTFPNAFQSDTAIPVILTSPHIPYETAFLRALPHGIVAGIHLPSQPDPVPELVLARLLPEERSYARSLRGFRQVQFIGGRLAFSLLAPELGVKRVSVLSNEGGAPVLPSGLLGSISHKQHLAVAILARGQGGLGIDLEETDRDRPGVAAKVLRPEELQFVQSLPLERRWIETVVRFSLKESLYKAIYRYVQRYVAFDEVAIWPSPEGMDRVECFFPEGPFRLEARHTWVGNQVLSSVRVWEGA
jgi:4'-phosphopantetheinyl transferase EntD